MTVTPVRTRFRVEGIVQGVGFRPFVHAIAHRFGLSGSVGNDLAGVFIEAEGPAGAVARFRRALEDEAPPLALIERITAEPLVPNGVPAGAPHNTAGFTIVPSRGGPAPRTPVSPDTATCADCVRELFDPADRRYRHPFITCTGCGPRFTIVRDLPYDRPRTTMAGFPMCGQCAAEYEDPANRRYHAQPVCCPECGPALRLTVHDGHPGADPIAGAVDVLRRGGILAIKSLGGYHLAVDATDVEAVGRLRSRKHRAAKPFAVLVPDLATAERLAEIGPLARDLLASPERPIVLVPRRPGTGIADAVAPGRRELGLMLPYTPPHWLLTHDFAGPLVMTSGNRSDEPIAYRDEEAAERLGGIADAFLTHDRPIHVRTDDSVVRVSHGRATPVRRSRGHAPRPLPLDPPATRPLLGCGAELKSTFCLVRDGRAYLSHHIGDLENHETFRSYTEGIAHFRRLLGIEPALIVHDLHPEYLSSKYAARYATEYATQYAIEHDHGSGAELLGVQHHHAHIASCLVDNQEAGPVIGVAFDGLGLGTDGTLWGGEFLIADLKGFRRAAYLVPVPLPGGAAAIKEPWRMAAAYLPQESLEVRRRQGRRWDQIVAMAAAGLNSPPTSSAGRVFDAVAALLGLRDTIEYEGQAAIELEQCADPSVRDAYPAHFDRGRISASDLVRAAAADLRAGTAVETIAARFHNGMASLIVDTCVRLRDDTGLTVVALSGGVFQNALLVARTVPALERHGFHVLTHRHVPPNDGGISLGQVAIAAALDRTKA
ncbi:carbamoyltransferase HypF [Actinomadura sp. 9N407]|uniref:carbamoyltransferase HypF n=1 Tax=Actinomadura sp. 9N407 TaxID=3375154 RepID=UPI0037B627EF